MAILLGRERPNEREAAGNFPHSSSLVPAGICARAFQENGLFQTAPHVPVCITKYPESI